jgi:thiol-disulfide isomerase/thioredoxin
MSSRSIVLDNLPSWALATALGLLLAGCSDSASVRLPGRIEEAASPQRGGSDGTSVAERGGPNLPAEPEAGARQESDAGRRRAAGNVVTVRVIDEKGFAEALQARRGKVVLVDLWATWCPSCMELFPHTVELHKKFADRDLAVISLSFDDPSAQKQVLRFLESKGATFANFLSRYGGSDRSIEAFGLDDLVLPRYHLYDRAGKLYKTLRSSGGPLAAEDVDRAVKELLGRS